jgi:hypothetical protein
MQSTKTSIFSFDHGQKKLNKAIGVEESYMDDLQEQIGDVLKDYLFDEDKNLKDDLSPSLLVEKCLHEFSYNQLILMSSFFLQNKIEEFAEMTEKKLKKLSAKVQKIALDEDDIPPHIKDALIRLMEEGQGTSKNSAINGDDLPQEIKDFLDSIVNKSDNDGDGDDD